MRDLIKIIIAISFTVGAFLVGKYLADDNCSIRHKEMDSIFVNDKKRIRQLEDSLAILKIQIISIYVNNLADTSKIKISAKAQK
jgi:hypothetical protein